MLLSAVYRCLASELSGEFIGNIHLCPAPSSKPLDQKSHQELGIFDEEASQVILIEVVWEPWCWGVMPPQPASSEPLSASFAPSFQYRSAWEPVEEHGSMGIPDECTLENDRLMFKGKMEAYSS